jgi:hypothetical protein
VKYSNNNQKITRQTKNIKMKTIILIKKTVLTMTKTVRAKTMDKIMENKTVAVVVWVVLAKVLMEVLAVGVVMKMVAAVVVMVAVATATASREKCLKKAKRCTINSSVLPKISEQQMSSISLQQIKMMMKNPGNWLQHLEHSRAMEAIVATSRQMVHSRRRELPEKCQKIRRKVGF